MYSHLQGISPNPITIYDQLVFGLLDYTTQFFNYLNIDTQNHTSRLNFRNIDFIYTIQNYLLFLDTECGIDPIPNTLKIFLSKFNAFSYKTSTFVCTTFSIDLFSIQQKVLFYFFISYFIILLYVYIQRFLSKKKTNLLQKNTTYLYEENLFLIEDVQPLFALFIIFIFYNIGLLTIKVGVLKIIYLLIWCLVTIIISIIFQLIFLLIIKYGLLFLISIKGSLKNNNRVKVYLEDSIASLAMFARYFIQSVRWLLVAITCFLLHEFYFTINWNTLNVFLTNILSIQVEYSIYFFPNLILNILRAVFEYIDCLFIFILQLLVFFTVLFWLLFFLFTTVIKALFEIVFNNK